VQIRRLSVPNLRRFCPDLSRKLDNLDAVFGTPNCYKNILKICHLKNTYINQLANSASDGF